MDATDLLLTGQAALVTGGGGGIGRGIAIELARAGADVVVADIDPDRAEQTAALVVEAGRQSLAVPTDVMDTEQVRAAVRAADERFGRLDILVNNAGGVTSRRFLDQSERSWRRHIDINLVSMLAATSAAAPLMIRDGRGGSIVNVSSIEGSRAAPTFSVYAACKAAMINFTMTMAVELAEHGIRVNCISPDQTATPGNHGLRSGPIPDDLPPRPPEVAAGIGRYVPLGREGTVDECGSVVTFLCSRLAAYVTGLNMAVDGGAQAASGWVAYPGGGWRLYPEMGMYPVMGRD